MRGSTTRQSSSMVIKRQIKQDYIRHPFTKQKLRVIDTFEPNDAPPCPCCKIGLVKEIKVVESEYPGGIRYNVIACNTCEEPVWVVPS